MKAAFALIAILAAAGCMRSADGAPYVERGQAKTVPWSGYWWPMRQGGLTGPLSKYDQLTGRRASDWERQNRPSGPNVPRWFGFCHAWSASSIMEAEPRQPCAQQGHRGPVRLAVGDQKGMLTACHTDDVANTYGERFGDEDGPEDPQDIQPDALWRVLKLYLKQQGVPVVLDIEAGPEVWNFPIYAYQLVADGSGDGQRSATLSLWMVDDGVPPDYVGSQVRRLSYTFSFQVRNGSAVFGSGRWTGRSQKDHPDFAWYPYLAKAGNPEVHHATVRKLVGQAGPEAPPASPERPRPESIDRPSPLPDPGSQADRPVLTPMELAALVANRTSSFGLDVTVDRFDGAQYACGEPITVRVRSKEAGYLYLFYLDHRGDLSLLYPLAGLDNRIAANQPIDVPGPEDTFAFVTSTEPGVHRIKAVVTARPVAFSGLVIQRPKPRPQQQQQRQQQLVAQQRAQQQLPRPEQALPQQQSRRPQQATRQQQQPAEPQQDAKGARGVEIVRQDFRLPPSQREQVQAVLAQYQQQNAPQQVDGVNPQSVVGRFAQDEVVFYADRAAKPGQTGGVK